MADWRRRTREIAQEAGVDPDLFEAQINQESGFNPTARSPAGASGIAQIMPATARGWGVDPMNPEAALRAAARNMATYQKKYGIEGALRAYNAGEGAIEKSKGYAETNNYVKTIMAAMGKGGSHGGTGSTSLQPSQAAIQATTPTGGGTGNIFDFFAATTPTATPLQSQLQRGWDLLSQLQDQRTAGTVGPKAQSVGNNVFSSTPFQEKTGKKGGVGDFEGTKVAGWISPILQYAREHGWKGQVNSGFRSFEDQTRIYNSGVRPAAKPGTSNHEGAEFPRGAVDVSDAAQLAQILARSPYKKRLVWAGAKDPVHFSFPHNGSY
jgi:hypothetical protein